MEVREFNDVFLPLSKTLYRVAFYILESGPEAEDAVQDLYLKLWKQRDALDTIKNPKAYCTSILKNLCIDRLRKSLKDKTTGYPEDIPQTRCPSDDMDDRERLSRTMEAIGKLSESQRTVLYLKVYEDLPYEEISRITGMNNLTLRVLLSQARKKLKKAI